MHDSHNTKNFIVRLRQALARPLPGLRAQRCMAPLHRVADPRAGADARRSAVLALLYPAPPHAAWSLLFTLRPLTLAHHAGQISFPGGGWEPGDADLGQTALRETREELGIPAHAVSLLGCLTPLYIPPSRNLVTPFVGWTPALPPLHPDTTEVAEVLRVPLTVLLAPETLSTHRWTYQGESRLAPSYGFNRHHIWGATAMMLSELLAVVREAL